MHGPMQKQLRVLIVEDCPDDAELLVRQLAQTGFTAVSRCVDSETAFLQQIGRGWDVILADYAMPGFGALRVLELAAKLAPAVPIIIVSGTIGEEVATEVMKLGAADYLLKDRLARLGQAIDQAIARSRLQQEKLRAEAALAESEQRLRAIVESEPECVKIVAADGTLLEMNPAGLAMIEADDRAQVIGRQVLELVHPADRKAYAELHRSTLEGAGGKLSFRIISLRGALRWMEITSVPLREAGGRIASMLSVTRDITAHRAAEEQLRESETRFRQLAENIHQVFWLTDPSKSQMLYVSPAYEEIWCRSREELMRNPKAWLEAVHPDDRPRVLDAALTLQGAGRYDEQYRILRPDGSVRWIRDRAFPVRNEMGAVYRIAGIAEDVTERRQSEERLAFLAQYDPLTSLPNRNLFQDRLLQAVARAERGGRKVAVMLIDLDRFKEINDTLGHAAGDLLLRDAAQRMKGVLRSVDTLARLGGDEFTLIQEDVAGVGEIIMLAQRVLDLFAQPFLLQGRECFITPSIGIAVHPTDERDPDALLRSADIAMYHAKQLGRNNYQFYQRDLHAKSSEQLLLETSLRRALERAELILHYQPQFETASRRLVGAEALIRWHSREFGAVPPARFIPLAEETGMIGQIGEWVARTACRDAQAWRESGLPPLRIAVNVSAHQLRRRDLVDQISGALNQSGLPPACLELEITESVLMQHGAGTLDILGRLRNLGVGLAIDDFGTGYSSLAYLKRFPVRKLKIDQSFVRNIGTDADDAAIVTAIISMAKSLNLKVTAEGVETRDQLDFLATLSCDEYQGYIESRPLLCNDFIEFARARTGS
jgi:diguanylate cyclase (GGDEF)-like protein/PAS domain S-box-containing protein